MRYTEQRIMPCGSGCGEYEQGTCDMGEAWDDADDLLAAMRDGVDADMYELGADALPDGIEDIRGRIHNQAGRIMAWLDDTGQAQYTALVEGE